MIMTLRYLGSSDEYFETDENYEVKIEWTGNLEPLTIVRTDDHLKSKFYRMAKQAHRDWDLNDCPYFINTNK